MKPERIEEIQKTCREYREDGCAYGPHVYLDEMDHLLRCARAVAELDRAWNYRIQKMREGVMISFQGIPENPREESEGSDLLTAVEAALKKQ